MIMQPRLLLSLAVAIFLLSVTCSTAPPKSASEQRLADARSNLKASDFNGALTNLDFALRSGSDDAAGQQAVVLRAAVATALADASKQMAEAYAIGAKEPSAQSRFGPFSKMRLDYYGIARAHLMNAMQSVMDQRRKLSGSPIPIEVTFPGFTGGTDPTVTKIKSGQWVADNDRYAAELLADRNALAGILTAMAGGGQEPNKGQQIFAAGKVDIDPRVYLIELSSRFVEIGGIFGPQALNEPDHLRIVNQVVEGNLEITAKLLAAKPDKDLEARAKKMQEVCEKTLKKLGV
jgi:hypothetical protein